MIVHVFGTVRINTIYISTTLCGFVSSRPCCSVSPARLFLDRPPLLTGPVTMAYANAHRRMRRGGRGGCSPPPQLLGNSVFWAAAVLFWAAAMVGGGCFSIFRRVDDVTRTMSKGGGGACEIPPFRKSCIRACYLCKMLGNQPLRPPPP